MDFFGDFRLRDTFQERIAPKPTKIDVDKLHRKFSVLNADFNSSNLEPLFSETCAHGLTDRVCMLDLSLIHI